MSEKEYIKQLEEVNHILQQKVEDIQVYNENLKSELSKYAIRLKNFSKTQWHVYLGNAIIGEIKFDDDNLYRVRLQVVISGVNTEKFSSLDLCRKFIINYITDKPKGDGWKITI